MVDAARYPVDYDAIRKGDYIAPERIVEISGEKIGTERFSLEAARLSGQIQRELWDRDKRYTVCVRDHGIAILTDAEASTYNAARFEFHTRGLVRSHVKMSGVDGGVLTESDRKVHDRVYAIQGRVLAAIADVGAVVPVAYRRQAPQLPEQAPEGA